VWEARGPIAAAILTSAWEVLPPLTPADPHVDRPPRGAPSLHDRCPTLLLLLGWEATCAASAHPKARTPTICPPPPGAPCVAPPPPPPPMASSPWRSGEAWNPASKPCPSHCLPSAPALNPPCLPPSLPPSSARPPPSCMHLARAECGACLSGGSRLGWARSPSRLVRPLAPPLPLRLARGLLPRDAHPLAHLRTETAGRAAESLPPSSRLPPNLPTKPAHHACHAGPTLTESSTSSEQDAGHPQALPASASCS
jgi:hypothetical protein